MDGFPSTACDLYLKSSGDNTLVTSADSDTVVGVNPVAASILRLCNGHLNVCDISDAISQNHDIEVTPQDIKQFLSEIESLGWIYWNETTNQETA